VQCIPAVHATTRIGGVGSGTLIGRTVLSALNLVQLSPHEIVVPGSLRARSQSGELALVVAASGAQELLPGTGFVLGERRHEPFSDLLYRIGERLATCSIDKGLLESRVQDVVATCSPFEATRCRAPYQVLRKG
jgi:hypothetical protein